MKAVLLYICSALFVVSCGCGSDPAPPLSEVARQSRSGGTESSHETEAVRNLQEQQEQSIRDLNASLKANEKAIQSVETDIEEVRGDVADNRKDIDNIQSTLDGRNVQPIPEALPAEMAAALLQQLEQQAAQRPVAVQPGAPDVEPHMETCVDQRVQNAALQRDVFWQTVMIGQARLENYRLQRELRASQWRERSQGVIISDPLWQGRTFVGHRW